MNTDEPLIHTIKGNMPVASLEYRHEWREDDDAIYLIEEYTHEGELVRRNVHARMKKGLASLLKQSS